MSITLRSASPQDEAFLLEVYASTRAFELSLVQWSDEEREAFVKSQFNAQHSYYRQQYPEASFDLILNNGERVGRLYVLREEDAIRILDITVLPQHRNTGIGTKFIHELLAESEETRKPVEIWVEQFNPSLRLFERLGFLKIKDDGYNNLLEWRPKK